MYVIQHKENKTFYKSKISKDIKHFVVGPNDSKKFKTYEKAKEILKDFKHPKNYKIIELKGE